MDSPEIKNLKQALKIDLDAAYAYMRFALAVNNSKTNEEEDKSQARDSKEWLVDSLRVLDKQIDEKCKAYRKEIHDVIEKIS